MNWKTAASQDRDNARADLKALAADGVRTSLSQVISAEADVSAWRGGRITLGQLCKRRGWDREVIHPEYRTNAGELRVYMPLGQFQHVAESTKKAVGSARHGFRTKQGSIRPLPVVSIRQRNGQTRDQHLSGRAWEAKEDGMVWAEILANRAPHHERGYDCLMCSIHGADRLRQDADDRTGLVCETCLHLYDMTKTAFINA